MKALANRLQKVLKPIVVLGLFIAIVETGSGATEAPFTPPSRRLQQELMVVQDLRAFAQASLHRPSEGGLLYARYVGNLCGRDWTRIAALGRAALQERIRKNGTVETFWLARMESLQRRCASFLENEPHAVLAEVKARPDRQLDPLLNAENELRSAARSGDLARMRAALKTALLLDDPVLWSERRLYVAVAQADPEARKVLGIFLGGRVYSEKDGIAHLEASTAMDLGFCKQDRPCALDDELTVTCASGGACAPDIQAQAKNYYFANGGTTDGWQRVLVLTDQVRAAIARADVGFFIR